MRVRFSRSAIAVLVVAGVVATGAFLAGRAFLGSDAPAIASPGDPPSSPEEVTPLPTPENPDEIDTSRPGWGVAYRQADRALRRYEQTLNGIPIGPDAKDNGGGCGSGPTSWASVEEARQIDPAFVPAFDSLPEGAVPGEQRAIICDGRVAHLDLSFEIPAEPGASQRIQDGESWFDVGHGGSFTVYKNSFANPGYQSRIASERWEAATVGGLPAAVGRAILRDEFGESAVVVWDEPAGVQVVVRAFEVELTDLLDIAEEASR
jgi:hypothetical protein